MFKVTSIALLNSTTAMVRLEGGISLCYPNQLIPTHIQVGVSLTQEDLELQEFAPATITSVEHIHDKVIVDTDARTRHTYHENEWDYGLGEGSDLPGVLVDIRAIKKAWGL